MHTLSNKEKKALVGLLPKAYSFDKKDVFHLMQISKENKLFLLLKNSQPFLIQKEGHFFPHLLSFPDDSYASVFIDNGALLHILKGAALMRPGIVEIRGTFTKGDVLAVRDMTKGKAVALGLALCTSEEMAVLEKGKVVQIYHYFNDEFYSK